MASAREEYNKEKRRLNRRFKAYEKQGTAKKSFSDIVKDLKRPTKKSVERLKNMSAKDLQKNFYVEDEQGNKKSFTDYMHEKRSEASKKGWESRRTSDEDSYNESVAQGILDLLNLIKANKNWSDVKAKCDDIASIIQSKLEDDSDDELGRKIKNKFFKKLDENSGTIFSLLEGVLLESRQSVCLELLSRVISILNYQIIQATQEAEEELREDEEEEEEEEDDEAEDEGGWMDFDEDDEDFEYFG